MIRYRKHLYRVAQDDVDRTDERVEKLKKHATGVLNKNKVYGELLEGEKGVVAEEDGVDLIYNVSKNGLKQATIIMDYTTSGITNKLNEVIFNYCSSDFVATEKATIPQLLSAIHTLQVADDRPPQAGESKGISKDDPEIVQRDFVENTLWTLVKKGQHSDLLEENQQQFIKKLKQYEDEFSTAKMGYDDFVKAVKLFSVEGWRSLIQQIQQSNFTTSKMKVDRAVRKLTNHEGYTGPIKYDIDEKGRIVAAINTPYPFAFHFTYKAGKLTLEDAGFVLCNIAFVSDQPNMVRALVSATLDLAEAYETAVNPEVSKPVSKEEGKAGFSKWTDDKLMQELQRGVNVDISSEGDEFSATVELAGDKIADLTGEGQTRKERLNSLKQNVLQIAKKTISEHNLPDYFFITKDFGSDAGTLAAVSSQTGRVLHNFGQEFL
jgi:hypothetical protein